MIRCALAGSFRMSTSTIGYASCMITEIRLVIPADTCADRASQIRTPLKDWSLLENRRSYWRETQMKERELRDMFRIFNALL
jgi:hypothetical protein